MFLFLKFVSASQPINALAFIFDGLHYGVSDFSYSASSMVCAYNILCYFDHATAVASVCSDVFLSVLIYQSLFNPQMVVGALSSLYLLYAPKVFGLPGVWAGLALFMSLRMTAGFMR